LWLVSLQNVFSFFFFCISFEKKKVEAVDRMSLRYRYGLHEPCLPFDTYRTAAATTTPLENQPTDSTTDTAPYPTTLIG